mgnify:CR=1 FL=1
MLDRWRHRARVMPLTPGTWPWPVVAGKAVALPEIHAGIVEARRAVTLARRSALQARTQAVNQ